ncbi:E3 ubiquitin-protein ligase SPL2-like [Silene latifolia]|uniref:E3 ubiquitin-protein ligase SPL2-like n=1 Tax=Silene latifolia TaxID=37657 RepID=UPI003D775A4A
MDVTLVQIAAFVSSIGTFCASRVMNAEAKRTLDQIANLSSIPDVPIGVASAMVPNPNAKSRLVLLRGVVLPLSSVDNLGDAASPSQTSDDNALVSDTTHGLEAVVIVSQTKHIYNGGCSRPQIKLISDSRKQVPFIIAKELSKSCNEYVFVNWKGREDRIPLEQVNYSKKELLNLSHREHDLTVEEVNEEKALPQGTVVTALGYLNSDKGIPTIEPSELHSFFLTTKSKEQMIEELSNQVEEISFQERMCAGISACLVGLLIGTFIGIPCKRIHYY